jgi:hypothetical protein
VPIIGLFLGIVILTRLLFHHMGLGFFLKTENDTLHFLFFHLIRASKNGS